jgi:hypothetical protein
MTIEMDSYELSGGLRHYYMHYAIIKRDNFQKQFS